MAWEEWPITGGRATRGAGCVLARPDAERARLRAAGAAVRAGAEASLTDAERARVPAIVEGLAIDIERDLRLLILPRLDEESEPEAAATMGSAAVPLAAPRVLGELPLHPGLLAAALQRAECHRLARVGERAPVPAESPAAAARMALILAEEARRDRWGEPSLHLDDLPAEAATDLVWSTAAALRAWLVASGLAPARADALAVDAGRARLAEYDEDRGLLATANRFGRALPGGEPDAALLVGLAEAGELYALTGALSRAAGLTAEQAWPLLAEPGEGRLALLLRASGVERDAAAAITLRLLSAGDDPVAEMDALDRCSPEGARAALAVLRHDPAYARAARALGSGW